MSKKDIKRYKLYNQNGDYVCKITVEECCFLWGLDSDSIEEINNYLVYNSTGYYIKL